MAMFRDQEIQAIQNEVLRLEAVICQLEGRRLALLRRLNCIQPSARVLPPEVLALIFEFALPPVFPEVHSIHYTSRGDTSILTLSHVSSYWRQVAWSAPTLWSGVQIEITQTSGPGILPILALHFDNSRDIPLSIDLNFDLVIEHDASHLPPPALEPSALAIERFLNDDARAAKIRALRLFDMPAEWTLNSIPKKLPHLRHLFISHSWVYNEPTHYHHSLQNLTSLKNVVFSELRGQVVLPWSSITNIELFSTPIDTCVNLLTQCPNLITFASTYVTPIFDDEEEPVPPPNVSISLPHLKKLKWSSIVQEMIFEGVLSSLRLPALQSFALEKSEHEWRHFAVPGPLVKMWFHALDNLHALQLETRRWWSHELFKDIFQKARLLRTLKVTLDIEGIRGVLRILSNDDDSSSKYLPYLTKLVIEWIIDGGPFDGEVPHEILSFCQARQTQSSGFCIKVRSRQVRWPPAVREGLREIIQRGFQLEVWDATGRVLP